MNKLTATALACCLTFAAAGAFAADTTVSGMVIESPTGHHATAEEGAQSDVTNYHGMAAEPMKEEPASPDSMTERKMKEEPISHDTMAEDGVKSDTEQ